MCVWGGVGGGGGGLGGGGGACIGMFFVSFQTDAKV